MVDLFFYRDPDQKEKKEEEHAEPDVEGEPEAEGELEAAPATTMGDFAAPEPTVEATWEQAKPEEAAAPEN